MDVSEHTMITRSMKKKMEEEGIYSPFEEDEIDENGNLRDGTRGKSSKKRKLCFGPRERKRIKSVL